MKNEDFKKLVAAVKRNPALLHALAFEPKKAGPETDFITETDRTMLDGMQAENLLGHALGILESEGCGATCQVSCGSQTCVSTCGPTGSFGALEQGRPATAFYRNFSGRFAGCTDTCVGTCQGGSSCACTAATNEASDMERINPASARFAVRFYSRAIPGGVNVGCGPDYTCCCTSGTCGGVTCGGSTCDVTCSGDSCGNTCGNSCGYTSNLTFDPLRRERLLAQQINRPLFWK